MTFTWQVLAHFQKPKRKGTGSESLKAFREKRKSTVKKKKKKVENSMRFILLALCARSQQTHPLKMLGRYFQSWIWYLEKLSFKYEDKKKKHFKCAVIQKVPYSRILSLEVFVDVLQQNRRLTQEPGNFGIQKAEKSRKTNFHDEISITV